MPIAKELALKILGALAVGGTAVGGGIALKSLRSKGTESDNNATEDQGKGDKTETQGDNTPGQDQKGDGATDNQKAETPPEKDADTSKILEELGLSCGKDNYCSLATGKKLSVKQENKSGTLTSLTSTGSDGDEHERKGGKIRLLGTEGEDKKKISFTIEDGNIRPTWENGSSSITKLEEFETYEIEEEGGEDGGKKYHFKRKAKALDEMTRLLGLSGSGCTLPTGGDNSTKSCDLDQAKLKAINFEGKKDSEDPKIIGDTGSVTLKINKLNRNVDENNYSKYPYGYQFVLSGDKEVKIPATPKEIVKKANDSLGFKIKVTPETGGPKSLVLEKIPQIERVASSLGFTECKEEGGAKTCKFPSKINVYKDDKNSIRGGSVSNWANQTITYEEDASDYEGEIKFTVSSDISISPGTIKGTFSKIAAGDYEIKQQTVDSQTLWYLSKKGK